MGKKRINRNFRQTQSARSGTDSARAYSQIQRFEGYTRVNKQEKPVRGK